MAGSKNISTNQFQGGENFLIDSARAKEKPFRPEYLSSNESDRDAWVKAIKSQDYHWFTTLTFPGIPSEEKVECVRKKFINSLNKKTFGKNYFKRKEEGVLFSYGLEYQERFSLHFTALFKASYHHISKEEFKNIFKNLWIKYSHCDKKHGVYIKEFIHDNGGEEYTAKDGYVEFSKNFPSPF